MMRRRMIRTGVVKRSSDADVVVYGQSQQVKYSDDNGGQSNGFQRQHTARTPVGNIDVVDFR